MKTKERILAESLKLFAVKGYDGVSVREIAAAVGVRESALYKHYKNKQEIMDSIIGWMRERIHETYLTLQVPELMSSDVCKGYKGLTEDALCNMAWNIFRLFTKDEYVAAYRKFLMREQFSNSAVAAQYRNIFIDGALESQSSVFAQLVQGGMFEKEDEKMIALHFYGPIYLLFAKYDSEPEKEDEIKELLFEHVRAFGREHTMM